MSTQPGGHEGSWWSPRAITLDRFVQGRFTGLTVVVLILALSSNVIAEKELRELVAAIGFSVLVGFAIWTVGPRLRVVTVALAIPTLLGHWMLQGSASLTLRVAGFALTTVFLSFLTLVILLAVLRNETVTADTIVGAVCAYFLLGITWGAAYALLALVSPDAFSVSPGLVAATAWTRPTAPFTPLLQYYSFTTLATLGYGDVSPLTGGARALSISEGLTGQLYLAVLIARLVGMHSARTQKQ